ncbi:MAG: hypothetical protein HQM02_13960, partial [Magnetococcales bacterium]|nr:hypothetical protein [Magnetococcales bacterium]
GVHVASVLPSGICFLLLLMWDEGTVWTRLRRVGVVALAATPVTVYYLVRMLDGGEAITLWSHSSDIMRLVHYRAPFFLVSSWSLQEWFHLALWTLLVPWLLHLLRDHLGERLASAARAVGWVALPYVALTQGLLEWTQLPFFLLLTGKGLEVLVPLQFLLLLVAVHRYTAGTGRRGMLWFFSVGCVAALGGGSMGLFCALLIGCAASVVWLPGAGSPREGRVWGVATGMVALIWTGVALSPWVRAHPRASPAQLLRIMVWTGMESPRLQGLLIGRQWFPERMPLSHLPPGRGEAAEFLRRVAGETDGLFAFAWRDNWWIMGLQAMARRGVFVDWDGGGDGTRAASRTWLREWFGRYGANQIFFSFPTRGGGSPEYRQWSYQGPGRERRQGALTWYMRRADDALFLRAAKYLYDRKVRWVVHLGPFPRATDLLQPVFVQGDVRIFRLSDPGPQDGMDAFSTMAAREPLPNEQPEAPPGEWH